MVNAWRRRRCLCLGLFGNWRTLCQLSNLSSSCTGLTGTSFRRDTTGHCIAILHIRGRRLAPVLVQLPEDQEDTEPDRTWIAIEQVEVAPGETGFGRLKHTLGTIPFDCDLHDDATFPFSCAVHPTSPCLIGQSSTQAWSLLRYGHKHCTLRGGEFRRSSHRRSSHRFRPHPLKEERLVQ